ncbi:hypothetical protein FQZ97_899820 [compost metagenome]
MVGHEQVGGGHGQRGVRRDGLDRIGRIQVQGQHVCVDGVEVKPQDHEMHARQRFQRQPTAIHQHGVGAAVGGHRQRQLVDAGKVVHEEVHREERIAHTAVPHLVAALAEVRHGIRALGTEIDQETLVEGARIKATPQPAGNRSPGAPEGAATELQSFLYLAAAGGEQRIGQTADVLHGLRITTALDPGA